MIKFPFLSRRIQDTCTIIQETPYRETSETSAAVHQNIFSGVFPIEAYKNPVKKSKIIRSPRETDRMHVAHTAEYYIMYISTKAGKSQYNSPTFKRLQKPFAGSGYQTFTEPRAEKHKSFLEKITLRKRYFGKKYINTQPQKFHNTIATARSRDEIE